MRNRPSIPKSGYGYSPKRPGADKGLRMSFLETLKLAMQDEQIKRRLSFVLGVFAVYVLGVHVPVPIPGYSPEMFEQVVKNNAIFQLMDTFGGGGLKRISIFALNLSPYISASIIMQIITATTPSLKKELQEGGEYAKRQQNRRTRALTVALCFFQGWGIVNMMAGALGNPTIYVKLAILAFWCAGTMFVLWLGDQITEKGIGNGISLLIFAGILVSLPGMLQVIGTSLMNGMLPWYSGALLLTVFLLTTWFVVLFTIAQRRIPIQHMRRQSGAKLATGNTSYLPLSLNLAGVIPIIFALTLVYMPAQFQRMLSPDNFLYEVLGSMANFLMPDLTRWQGVFGCLVYTSLIFFFTYFYTAIQYNVEDIANNLKRGGSFIPGIRPGKQTKEFLDGVISRITFIGAIFLAGVALTQYVVPLIANGVANLGLPFGTSLLIMVSVALETMRQIEANILMKQYGQGEM